MRRWSCVVVFALSAAAARGDRAAALELFAAQRYAEAQEQFEASLAADPHDVVTLHHLGRLAVLRGDLAAAVEHLAAAVAQRPDDAALQFEFGAACSLRVGQLGVSWRVPRLARRGRAALERAVALAPDDLRYRQALFEFHRRMPAIASGRAAGARAQAEAIRARDPLQGTYALAALALDEERPADALALWQALLEREPANPFALFEFGQAAALSGRDVSRGIAALERYLASPRPAGAPPPAEARWRLGELRLHRGDIAGARREFEQGLALAPAHAGLAAALAALPVP